MKVTVITPDGTSTHDDGIPEPEPEPVVSALLGVADALAPITSASTSAQQRAALLAARAAIETALT